MGHQCSKNRSLSETTDESHFVWPKRASWICNLTVGLIFLKKQESGLIFANPGHVYFHPLQYSRPQVPKIGYGICTFTSWEIEFAITPPVPKTPTDFHWEFVVDDETFHPSCIYRKVSEQADPTDYTHTNIIVPTRKESLFIYSIVSFIWPNYFEILVVCKLFFSCP